MPQIFKALVTVSAWAMFICSWVTVLTTVIAGGIVGGEFTGAEPPSMQFFIGLAVSGFFAFAGGFLLIVRKKLE